MLRQIPYDWSFSLSETVHDGGHEATRDSDFAYGRISSDR